MIKPEKATDQLPEDDLFWSDFAAYIDRMEKTLDESPFNVFTPDLEKLDALIASLKVP
jgi:hypothetical protein